MKRPGWRTDVAYRLRAWWRQLLIAWYGVQVWVEEWWEKHVVGREPEPGIVFGIPWSGPLRPWYPDGERADVYVSEGHVVDQVDVYLRLISRPAPKEILG